MLIVLLKILTSKKGIKYSVKLIEPYLILNINLKTRYMKIYAIPLPEGHEHYNNMFKTLMDRTNVDYTEINTKDANYFEIEFPDKESLKEFKETINKYYCLITLIDEKKWQKMLNS